ncbi:MAG TPA: hypothetical protein VMQ52_02245 [Candidatus Saccharimonadales bacterium]|nr:hypothetical protein [Candidatus Saccharimonadales bacterium]
MPNTIFTPGPQEIRNQDKSHEAVRAQTGDMAVELAIRAAMVQFQKSLAELINNAAPVSRQPEIVAQPAIIPIAQPAESVVVNPVATPVSEALANLSLMASARAELDRVYGRINDEAA